MTSAQKHMASFFLHIEFRIWHWSSAIMVVNRPGDPLSNVAPNNILEPERQNNSASANAEVLILD